MEVAQNLHTQIIGRNGQKINALKELCGGQCTIRFPGQSSNSSTVSIKGPRQEVAEVQRRLGELVSEITERHYEEIVNVTLAELRFYFSKAIVSACVCVF